MANASGSPSASLHVSVIAAGVSSVVVTFCELAVGGELAAALTAMVTVALSHSTGFPLSQTRYEKVSRPLKFALGMYVMLPSGLTWAVP